MTLQDRLTPIHCCGQIGTLNMEDKNDLAKVAQQIEKDILELLDKLGEHTIEVRGYPYSYIQSNELRLKLKEYFSVV